MKILKALKIRALNFAEEVRDTARMANAMTSKKGLASMEGASNYVFGALILILLFVAVAPAIFSGLNGLENDGNLSAAEAALMSVFGIVVIWGVLKYFLGSSGSRR